MIGLCLFLLIVGVVILLVKQQAFSSQIDEMRRRLDWVEDELHRVGKIADARHAERSPVLGTVRPPIHPGSMAKDPGPSGPPPLPVVSLPAHPIRSVPTPPPRCAATSAAITHRCTSAGT